MSKKYCPSCGFGTSSLNDINFCNSCGYNFKLGKSTAQHKEDTEESEDDNNLKFNTANLKYKVEIFDPPKYDLGKLTEERKTGELREKGSILTAQAGLEEFKRRTANNKVISEE